MNEREQPVAKDPNKAPNKESDAQKKKGDAKTAESEGVQELVDAEHEQGFRGTKVDPTPNHAYTVEGVTSGEPTPETDKGAAAEARERGEALREVEAGKPADE